MTVGRSTSPTHQLGGAAEDAALAYLRSNGLILLAQNWHVHRVGELDLVMLHDNTLVFVEVKKRSSSAYGGALASVTQAKQRKIVATATHFLAAHEAYAQLDCRFDVVALQGQKITWLQAAFLLS